MKEIKAHCSITEEAISYLDGRFGLLGPTEFVKCINEGHKPDNEYILESDMTPLFNDEHYSFEVSFSLRCPGEPVCGVSYRLRPEKKKRDIKRSWQWMVCTIVLWGLNPTNNPDTNA